ncbi:hypothetical protein FHR90_002726 [Endobacter medicaginis]|uniref:AAA+ ATPase domain-containing protein n=3 Tax=Endobacter medicaginis TaxID=1181271 RepID=A0A839V5R8_9PROT|nr:ATP-binding protein [Endobacter medicaginis]MBB3174879.1 hypothetical protein [Endobacter medicaginis]
MAISIGLGEGTHGGTVPLDLEELLATRLLVQGNSGSGKSHLLRRLMEQSAPFVQQAVIDPEGDFVSLAERFGHLVIDAASQSEAQLHAAGLLMREHRVSVILDLEGLDADGQMRRAAAFLDGMFDAPREQWYPVLVVVDEAQLFAPAVAGEVSDEARRLSLGAMANLMSRGRKRGLAGVIATQRLAKLAKNVAAEASNFLMGRTFLDIDMARAADLLGLERRQAEMFRDLARGDFIALGPALSRRPIRVRIGAVETASRGSGPVLTPPPAIAAESVRALILAAPDPGPAAARPRRTPTAAPVDVLAELARARPAEPVAPPPIDPAEREALASRAIETLTRLVAAETETRPLAAVIQAFHTRLRIEALPIDSLDPMRTRRLVGALRAGIDAATAETPPWTLVAERADTLPEDLQPIFLLLAAHALRAAPCPDDAALAHAYGTHSLARARRQLAYLEQLGAIVIQPGNRIALVGLGWETAAAA